VAAPSRQRMNRTDVVPQPSEFARVVLDAFKFLEGEYDFRRARIEAHVVRYESETVFVEVYRDERTSEGGVSVGLRHSLKAASPQPSSAPVATIGRAVSDGVFSLDEIIAYSAPNRAEQGLWGSAFIISQSEIEKWLPRLAASLQQVGQSMLTGELNAFDEARLSRSRAAHSYTVSEQLRAARASAAKAWHLRDYEAVVRVLEPIEGQLTQAEAKKLGYAKQHRDGRL
jgi:hypothetical protein